LQYFNFPFQVKISQVVSEVGTSGAAQHIYYTEVEDRQRVSKGTEFQLFVPVMIFLVFTNRFE
jgi:hypothetical protein